jgi:putative membrane protein (TIGR04086 family)
MLKGHMTTGFVSGGVIAAYVISCLVGGFCVGQYMGKHKFLWGTLIGLFYFFILYLLGAIIYSKGFQMSLQVFGSCLICIVSGMLGGMLAPAEKR